VPQRSSPSRAGKRTARFPRGPGKSPPSREVAAPPPRRCTLAVLMSIWLGAGALSTLHRPVLTLPAAAVKVSGGYLYVARPGDTLWAIASRLQPGGDPRPLVAELEQQLHGAQLVAGDRSRCLSLDASGLGTGHHGPARSPGPPMQQMVFRRSRCVGPAVGHAARRIGATFSPCAARGVERPRRVVDSREVEQGGAIRRRRECISCTRRFTTVERVSQAVLWSSNGRPAESPSTVRGDRRCPGRV